MLEMYSTMIMHVLCWKITNKKSAGKSTLNGIVGNLIILECISLALLLLQMFVNMGILEIYTKINRIILSFHRKGAPTTPLVSVAVTK